MLLSDYSFNCLDSEVVVHLDGNYKRVSVSSLRNSEQIKFHDGRTVSPNVLELHELHRVIDLARNETLHVYCKRSE